MATSTLTAAMPVLELTEGESLVLEAIDPSTGLAVAGVVANNFVIYATDSKHDDPTDLTLENIYLTPMAAEVTAPESRQINPPDFGGPAG
jgi:hypothetical protein